ncbi:signal transduction histidine kinase/ligand-binding sensor domain-containing protein [Sphingopyxis sp. OAS728]|uniref:sensor histidine kinase n=1 Tax=Sphingopyxis sp. OAS728 TaxID=2663823 RepID=UPI00178951D0|nr:two-component regulator propeller domain-containing protein [Sphingopyxis sp. OAS728]MBE1528989.1 signal transduction histidine kinase/ligand-binding sensor domain-containing protein [Sphingopyxis sp. OAS728]
MGRVAGQVPPGKFGSHSVGPRGHWRVVASLLAAALSLGSPGALALDPERSIHQYIHTKWGRAEGAPSPVTDILQTRDGYLWMSSGAGLYRFDGIRFERMDGGVDIAIEGPPVQLFLTRSGDLWVSYLLSERFRIYRRGKLVVVPSPPTNGQVVDFAETPDGAIWAAIGQIGQPMLRYAKGRWSRVDPTGGARKSSYDTLVTGDGALWTSYNDALYRLPAGAARFDPFFTSPGARMRIVTDREGRLWITDKGGSRAITGPGGRLGDASPSIAYPSDAFRRRGKTLFDRDGNLWVARRRDGVERLREPPGGVPAEAPPWEFRAADGLTSDTTHDIFEDREGNIWVGTALGLDRFRNANVIVEPALDKPAAYGDILYADRNGVIYIGQRDAVYRVAPRGAPVAIVAGISEPEAICEGPDGAIWIVAADGITSWKEGVVRQIAPPSEREDGIFDCGLDRWGRLWMSAAGSGLYRWDAGKWQNLPADRAAGFSPMQMVRGSEGDLWVLWGKNKVARLGGALPELHDVAKNPALGAVRTISPAPTGLWLGYDRGLGRLDERGLATADIRQIPALERAAGVLQMGAAETWVFGEMGVSRLDTAAVERALRNPAVILRARSYGFLDGLPDVRARARNRGLVAASDGRLWASTDAGSVWIDPARLHSNARPPGVAIGSVTTRKTRFLDPVNLTLPAGTSQLSIGFAALALGMPERVQIRYKLEGQDDQWVNPGMRRQAFYTNLGPGDYRFRVIAANEDGVWNREGATLAFSIAPTFVQTTAFKLLLLVAGLAGAIALYRFRMRLVTRGLQARFDIRIQERERIAREIHDTLLQGFQGLVLRFQAVANSLPQGAAARTALDDALERADAVLVEGRSRIRDLRLEPSETDLARALVARASEIVGPRGPRVELTHEGAARSLHPLIREEVERIAEEAIRNAVQHAQASRIEILLHWGAQELLLAVRDNGIGMRPSILDDARRGGHFGLTGMRERAERVGGRLTVTSREGAGTEIALTLSARAAYRNYDLSLFDRLRRAWKGGSAP